MDSHTNVLRTPTRSEEPAPHAGGDHIPESVAINADFHPNDMSVLPVSTQSWVQALHLYESSGLTSSWTESAVNGLRFESSCVLAIFPRPPTLRWYSALVVLGP